MFIARKLIISEIFVSLFLKFMSAIRASNWVGMLVKLLVGDQAYTPLYRGRPLFRGEKKFHASVFVLQMGPLYV